MHEGYGQGSVWKGYLPSKALKEIKDVHTNTVSTLENDEHPWSDLLLQRHHSIVERCRLSDILSHAVADDHEALQDIEVLSCFARSLIGDGKIRSLQSISDKSALAEKKFNR